VSGRRRLRELLPIVLGGVLMARASVAADTKTPVYVEMGTCEVASTDQVMSLVRVELGAQLVDAPPDTGCHVVVECSGDVVTVSVAARDRLKRSHRTDLAGSPANVRPRIVALEIAELVRDVAREPEVLRTAAVPRDRTPPDSAPGPSEGLAMTPSSADTPSRNRVTLTAFGLASTFRYDGRWLGGGGLRFDYARDFICAGLDATLATRQDGSDLGTARMLVTRLSPYAAWYLSASGVAVRLGAGYALGMARIVGTAENGKAAGASVTGLWGGPYALGGIAYAATDAVDLDLRAEAGWVLLPVVGQVAGGNDVAVQGPWASVQIGLSLAL
jgi:hypothetical protein